MQPGLTIQLHVGTNDLSRLFVRSHSEQTTNASKDENKYDLTIANGGGQLFNLGVKPKDIIDLTVINNRKTCDGDNPETIHIFTGEVQKIAVDETECKIEGSCMQGQMVSAVGDPWTWPPGTGIKQQVIDLLNAFGYDPQKAVIVPKNNTPVRHTPDTRPSEDFDTSMKDLADEAGCNYFFDEFNIFYFVPPGFQRGYRNLTRHVMKGQQASNMMGLSTIVEVYGWSYVSPDKPSSNNFAHKRVFATKRADDPDIVAQMAGEDMIANYGEVKAPAIYIDNCDQAMCEKIAKSSLLWFLQFKDVPQVKIEGTAPYVYSIVGYSPFNSFPVKITCDSEPQQMAGVTVGQVTKRVIDISADQGLQCTLDINVRYKDGIESDELRNIADANLADFTSQFYDGVINGTEE